MLTRTLWDQTEFLLLWKSCEKCFSVIFGSRNCWEAPESGSSHPFPLSELVRNIVVTAPGPVSWIHWNFRATSWICSTAGNNPSNVKNSIVGRLNGEWPGGTRCLLVRDFIICSTCVLTMCLTRNSFSLLSSYTHCCLGLRFFGGCVPLTSLGLLRYHTVNFIS